MKREQLEKLIHKLSSLGEDKSEMELWLKIFQDLDSTEQADLIRNLQKELQQLERLKDVDVKN